MDIFQFKICLEINIQISMIMVAPPIVVGVSMRGYWSLSSPESNANQSTSCSCQESFGQDCPCHCEARGEGLRCRGSLGGTHQGHQAHKYKAPGQHFRKLHCLCLHSGGDSPC